MFASGIGLIYKNISAIKDENKRNESYNYLENQIIKNPYIKHQFEVLQKIRDNKGKLTTENEFKDFCATLNKKTSEFIKEHSKSSHLAFWTETKKLLEYFNVNPKNIELSAFDTAIDIYASSKKINENVLKSIVCDQKQITDKRIFKQHSIKNIKNSLKESFKRLKLKENKPALEKQFGIIEAISAGVEGSKKLMIEAALESLKQKAKDNYKTAVENTYKLRVIAEANVKFVLLSADDLNLKYLSLLEGKIQVTSEENPYALNFIVEFTVYPEGNYRNAANTSLKRVRGKLEGVGEDIFDLAASTSDAFDKEKYSFELRKMLTQIDKIGETSRPKMIVYLPLDLQKATQVSVGQLEKIARKLLVKFDKSLPSLLGEYAHTLTPEAMEMEGKSDTKILNKRTATAHVGKKDSSLSGERWMDMFLGDNKSWGDNYFDKQPYYDRDAEFDKKLVNRLSA